MKLTEDPDGELWSPDKAELAEREYRRFLALNLMYPSESIVPCELVDKMWHAHILDTRAYAQDSARVFGTFFHHFPYFGLRGASDAQDLELAYDRTLEVYELEFGTPPDGVWADADSSSCGRKACKPMKCR
jgi:hypothetical protein